MTTSEKEQIDAMDYEALLRLWRTAPAGHPLFTGETGEYYSKRMEQLRREIGHGAHVAASKRIGWDE